MTDCALLHTPKQVARVILRHECVILLAQRPNDNQYLHKQTASAAIFTAPAYDPAELRRPFCTALN
jgi:hypothetical protein